MRLHTMPLRVDELLSSRRVRMLSLDEFGAFLYLLITAWQEPDGIPLAEVRSALPPMSDETWSRIQVAVVERFFTTHNGRLVNKKLEEVREEVITKASAGRMGAAKRWGELNGTCYDSAISKTIAPAIGLPLAPAMILPIAIKDKEKDKDKDKEEEQGDHKGEQAGTRKPPTYAIRWDNEKQELDGITHTDVARWSAAFPAVDVEDQLRRAIEWLRANPLQRKKNYARFLLNWFSFSQERGGR